MLACGERRLAELPPTAQHNDCPINLKRRESFRGEVFFVLSFMLMVKAM